jgi:hypothetical protein
VPRGAAWLWAGLAVALSPLLLDLARHLVEEPWARYALLFAPLTAVAVVTTRGRVRSSPLGHLLLALALAAELLAVAGHAPRLARPALPAAVAGLCLGFGLSTLRVAALSAWLVPVPSALMGLASPQLESLLFGAAARGVRALGRVTGPGAALYLGAWDGGLPLAALLSGLGFYAGLRRREPVLRLVRQALAWGAAALPAQAAGVLLATLATAAGRADLGRDLLDALWLPAALAGLARAELGRTLAPRAPTAVSIGPHGP